MIVKRDALKEYLSPIHLLITACITMWLAILIGIILCTTAQVEVNNVSELEHVYHGVEIEEFDFLTCWRDYSKDSLNSRISF